MHLKLHAVNEKELSTSRIRAFKINNGETFRLTVSFSMFSKASWDHLYVGYRYLQKRSIELHATLAETGLESKVFLEREDMDRSKVVNAMSIDDIFGLNFRTGNIMVDVFTRPSSEQTDIIVNFLKEVVNKFEFMSN